ncbi:MAG: hypothetical protein NTZ42_03980 [Candidatus Gribaldobacteria bacterium]|nr:hypothetical protein [Candidatus Gribaldobacteria bacterium]
MFNFDLSRITIHKFFFSMEALAAHFVPGLVYLYFFQPELFKGTDTIKLLLIAFIYSCPVVLAFVCGECALASKNTKKNIEISTVGAMTLSVATPFLSLALYFIFSHILNFNISFLVFLYALPVVGEFIDFFSQKRRLKRLKK